MKRSPDFTGAPAWPNLRQAYKTIRGPDGIVLATDGLSEPGIGVPDPARSVQDAVATAALEAPPDRRAGT